MSYIMKHLPNGFPSDAEILSHGDAAIFLNPVEAAESLGVTTQVFSGLVKQYGIGRYHLNRTNDQIVYSVDDLAKIKRALASRPTP